MPGSEHCSSASAHLFESLELIGNGILKDILEGSFLSDGKD